MPELGPKNTALFSEVKQRIDPNNKFDDQAAIEMAEKHGEEFIGQGGECIVFSDSQHKHDKVVTFNYKELTPEQATKTFYLQRFFSTLFPKNFPHFSLTAPTSKDKPGVTMRDRVYPAKNRDLVKTENSFFDVIKTCDNLGVKFIVDDSPDNFTKDDQGDEYYLDSLKSANFSEWDAERIKQYMIDNHYPDSQICRTEKIIDKIKTLHDTYKQDNEDREEFLKNCIM